MVRKNIRQAIFIFVGILQFIPYSINTYYSDIVYQVPTISRIPIDHVSILLCVYFWLVAVVYRLLGNRTVPLWMFLLHALLSILPYLFLGWLFMFNGDSSSSFSLRISFWNLFVQYGFLLAQIVFVLWVIIRSRNLTVFGLLLIFFASCGSRERFNVHVSDFEGAQQVVLKRILSDGFADVLNKQDDSLFAEQDLLRLTNAESPLLCAVALDELKRRQGTGFGKIGTNHLDDTAFVLHDHGEFGLGFETVTDVALEMSEWPDSLSRMGLLKRLLEQPYKHRSVYFALRNLDSISSFYPVIRQMAFQYTRVVDGYEKRFDERENALYALARF